MSTIENTPEPPTAAKSLVGKLLSPIADVHPGEERSVLLMTLIMFLVLGAYYMLKTAREVFILTQGGAAVKSYSSAGQAILLLALVPAYGAIRVARQPHPAGARRHPVLRVAHRAVRAGRWRRPSHRAWCTSSGSASST